MACLDEESLKKMRKMIPNQGLSDSKLTATMSDLQDEVKAEFEFSVRQSIGNAKKTGSMYLLFL